MEGHAEVKRIGQGVDKLISFFVAVAYSSTDNGIESCCLNVAANSAMEAEDWVVNNWDTEEMHEAVGVTANAELQHCSAYKYCELRTFIVGGGAAGCP